MAKPKRIVEKGIEIFRAGDHGPQGVWTVDDVKTMASSYDPAMLEGRITTDHKEDGPKFGEIVSLSATEDGRLFADLAFSEDFHAEVADRKWSDRSVEIYRKFSKTGGKPYLSAVTFLGAKCPAVVGMEPLQFSDANGTRVSCHAEGLGAVAFAKKPATGTPRVTLVHGSNKAIFEDATGAATLVEVVNPQPESTASKESEEMPIATAEKPDVKAEKFADTPEGKTLFAKVAELEAKIKTDAEKFATDKKASDERTAALEKRNRELEFETFADATVKELRNAEGGPRITKANEPSFREALKAACLADSSATVKFSENGVAKALIAAFKAAPAVVAFGEQGKPGGEGDPSKSNGYLDDLHDAAVKFAAEHKCDYEKALLAVSSKKP